MSTHLRWARDALIITVSSLQESSRSKPLRVPGLEEEAKSSRISFMTTKLPGEEDAGSYHENHTAGSKAQHLQATLILAEL